MRELGCHLIYLTAYFFFQDPPMDNLCRFPDHSNCLGFCRPTLVLFVFQGYRILARQFAEASSDRRGHLDLLLRKMCEADGPLCPLSWRLYNATNLDWIRLSPRHIEANGPVHTARGNSNAIFLHPFVDFTESF